VYGGILDLKAKDAVHANLNWITLDVRSDESVQRAVSSVLQTSGRIDVLINNAGVTSSGTCSEIREALAITSLV
jgi:NAD(P)-dependent dehydrogenase (short-subunit alcohol dehydrogenase family)